MIALIALVTYACPRVTSAGGCSLTRLLGVSHETSGSVPALASAKKSCIGTMFPSWWSWWTVLNHGNGFQMPGVYEFCHFVLQTIPPSSQSGCAPEKM